MSGSSRIKRANHAAGFDRSRVTTQKEGEWMRQEADQLKASGPGNKESVVFDCDMGKGRSVVTEDELDGGNGQLHEFITHQSHEDSGVRLPQRLGQGMKRLYGMDNLAVHPYMPGRLGVTSRFAHDFAPAAVVRPQKFGFFNQALPSVSAGHVNERRNEASKKLNVAKEGSEILPASILDEVPFDEEPRTIRPPSLNGSSAMPTLSAEIIDQKPIANVLPTPADADINAAINELFAKMVWKKLDLIKDPLRLSRLHTEIMNVLQQAVAEEGGNIV